MNPFCPSKGSFLSVPKDDLITLSFTAVVDAFRVVDRLMSQSSMLQYFEMEQDSEDLALSLLSGNLLLSIQSWWDSIMWRSYRANNPHLVPIHIELSPTTVCFFITCGTLWSHRSGCCALFHHFAQQQAALPRLLERSGRTEWAKRWCDEDE